MVVCLASILKQHHVHFPDFHLIGILQAFVEALGAFPKQFKEADCMHEKCLVNSVDVFLGHPLELKCKVMYVSDDSVTLTFRPNLSMPYLNKGSTCSGFPIVPGMEIHTRSHLIEWRDPHIQSMCC